VLTGIDLVVQSGVDGDVDSDLLSQACKASPSVSSYFPKQFMRLRANDRQEIVISELHALARKIMI
jgi:hypothetical protein